MRITKLDANYNELNTGDCYLDVDGGILHLYQKTPLPEDNYITTMTTGLLRSECDEEKIGQTIKVELNKIEQNMIPRYQP